MKKLHRIMLVIFLALIMVTPVMAEVTDEELLEDKSHNNLVGDQLLCGTRETAYSRGNKVTDSDHHGVFVRVVSTGVVDITITFENSITKTGNSYVLPDGCSWEWKITSAGDHVKALTEMAHFGWMRFKAVGGATNDASGIIDIVLSRDTKTQ